MAYCTNCGNKLPTTAKFCFNCGEKIPVQEGKSNTIPGADKKLKSEASIFKEYFERTGDAYYYYKDDIPRKKWLAFSHRFSKSNVSKYTVFFYHESILKNKDYWEEKLTELVSGLTSLRDRYHRSIEGFAIVLDNKEKWHLLLSGGVDLYLSKTGKHLAELLDEPGVLNLNICYKSGTTENMRFTELGETPTANLKSFLKAFFVDKTNSQTSEWSVYSIRE